MNSDHIKAQEKVCKEQRAPMFVPKNGICFRCGVDIFKDMTVEEARKEVITGCPNCFKSFVE